jgi:type IV secretion system protein VirD4
MEILVLVFGALVLLVRMADKARRKRIQKEIEEAYNFNPENAHGAARFADCKDAEKARMFKAAGIRIGFLWDGVKRVFKRLFFNGPGHIMLVAGARTGKAVTIIVEMILLLPACYSLLVFDPKAELASICGHWRKRYGEVNVLNPFGILLEPLKGLKQARFNPMSSLNPNSIDFHALCDKLAEAICWAEHTADSHWIESARLLISGIIATLAKYGKPEDRNLVTLRNVITGAMGKTVYEFCREAMALPDPYIRQKLGLYAAAGAEQNKELNSIVSSAVTQTGFIGNEAIAENLKGDDFRFADLKRKPGMTVFVCLPLDKLDVSSKYFRVMSSTGISDVLKEGLNGPGAPVLAILDEIAQIGPLKVISDAWAMAAGAAGLQLMAVYQDVSQIKNQFKTTWQTMVQNSAVAMYFGIRDQESAEFVSKQCGVTEVLSHSRSVSIDRRTGRPMVNDSATQTARPLLHPDEVRFGLGDDEMLLFCDGVPGVIRAHRKPYFRCDDLKGKYRDNPYFKKQTGKGFFSWLLE